jgi:hypothetical protein
VKYIKTILILLAVLLTASCSEAMFSKSYKSDLQQDTTRTWLGPEFWANRLQDWQLKDSRIECVETGPNKPYRTVHLLTHRVAGGSGSFKISANTGPIVFDKVAPTAATGFLIGAGANLDYRAAALIHHSYGPGAGILALVDTTGKIAFRDMTQKGYPVLAEQENSSVNSLPDTVTIKLVAKTKGDECILTFSVSLSPKSKPFGKVSLTVPTQRVTGNIAIVSHVGKTKKGLAAGAFWFDDLKVSGSRIAYNPDRTAGPILCTQHTLSDNILKLTAQMMPIAQKDNQKVELQTKTGSKWETISTVRINPAGYIAPFRITNWDSTTDTPYRVAYTLKDPGGKDRPYYWQGTIRHDPIEKETITIAGFTGNHNLIWGSGSGAADSGFCRWSTHVSFPHNDIVANVRKHNPDVLFFSGDQLYEGASPVGVDRENLQNDLLYKWFLWCWAFGDIARDIPTICIPDDHDVYQGNLWGEGGRKTDRDHNGGYVFPAEWINMTQRVQTSHLPDQYDPTPIAQGIEVYYAPMNYGRIGFAILEDRKFKSGCAGRVPDDGDRPDHIKSADIDPKTFDVPGVKLLGDRQMKFLNDWTADFNGHDMKIALSQTVFAGMATHHGGALERVYGDLDSNGWPQTPRNNALKVLRKGYTVMLAGDQHLASMVQHGVDEHKDAGWALVVPSICNFYPRGWKPEAKGKNRAKGQSSIFGDHLDGFGNKVTVHAVTNPTKMTGISTGVQPLDLHDKMPGYGIVNMNKKTRKITMQCWPRYADPDTDDQYAGWPKTIDQLDNYSRKPKAWLPTVTVSGPANPVIQITDQAGEIVYALRINGNTFQPGVFKVGAYTIKVGYPEENKYKTLKGVMASDDKSKNLELTF